MTTWTDEDEPRLSIEMALLKIKTKPRADRDGVYRRIVAEQIVAHLKLSQLLVSWPLPWRPCETNLPYWQTPAAPTPVSFHRSLRYHR